MVQECLMHWLYIRVQYAIYPESNLKNIMFVVTKNKLKDILKKNERNLRKIDHQSISLDELFDEDKKLLDDLIAEDESALQKLTRFELPAELMRVIEGLSLTQKQLCKLLGEEALNIKQISEQLNLPRTTIYEEINRIREIFKKEGLKDYL